MHAENAYGLEVVGPTETPAAGAVWNLVATGEIDLASAHVLSETIDAAIANGATLVVLDVRAVEFMDSSGLRAIVQCGQRLTAVDGRLLLTGMSGAVQRVFEISGLIDQYRS